nr:hypothetical protein [Streptomyces sp. ISL-66]
MSPKKGDRVSAPPFRTSASAIAYWKGPEDTYVRNCFAERTP